MNNPFLQNIKELNINSSIYFYYMPLHLSSIFFSGTMLSKYRNYLILIMSNENILCRDTEKTIEIQVHKARIKNSSCNRALNQSPHNKHDSVLNCYILIHS